MLLLFYVMPHMEVFAYLSGRMHRNTAVNGAVQRIRQSVKGDRFVRIKGSVIAKRMYACICPGASLYIVAHPIDRFYGILERRLHRGLSRLNLIAGKSRAEIA